EFLKCVAIDRWCWHILNKGKHRCRGEHCLGERWHQQRCGRAVLGGHHTDPTGDLGEAIGHRPAGLLGAIHYLSDADVFPCKNYRRRKALPEDMSHTPSQERSGYGIGDSHHDSSSLQCAARGLDVWAPCCRRARSALVESSSTTPSTTTTP